MSRTLPPLETFRFFEAAARHLNFTHAAEEMHVTHGAVSQRIKRLEEHLGTSLFRRSGRRMLLTDEGNRLLERVRTAISELYGHIQRDARHKDVVLLHYEEISERRFGGWTMGQVNLSKLNVSTLLKYSEKPELDPYSVSGKVSLALLEELMATAAIVGRH